MKTRPTVPVWRQPGTAAWYEGPPLGNGDLGVIVWGDRDLLSFGVGKNDVRDGRWDSLERIQFMGFQEYMHRAAELARPDEFYPTNVLTKIDKPNPPISGGPKPVCRIEISQTEWAGPVRRSLAPVTHELSLETATLQTLANGLAVRSRVQRDRNVAMVRLESMLSPTQIRLLRYPDKVEPTIPPATHKVDDATALIVQEFPAGPNCPEPFRFAVAATVVGAGKPVCDGASLEWHVTQPATLWLAVVTSRDAKDPVAAARRLLQQSVEEGEAALGRRHADAWRSYWDASWIRLDHERAQTLWYMANYFIASAARSGAYAPGLFGPWIVHDRVAWGGNHGKDYNFEQEFAGVLSSNHPELMLPYIELLESSWPVVEAGARKVFGCDGIAFARHGCMVYVCETPYMVQHVWDYYRYTGDVEFLKNRGYKWLAGCADFLASYATKTENGRYQFFPTRSPEHHAIEKGLPFHRNQIAELAFARWTFPAAIAAADIVGEKNQKRVAHWREVLDGLPAWPTYRTQAGEVLVDCEAQPADRNFTSPTPLPPRRDDDEYTSERRISKQVHNDGAWMAYNCPTVIWPIYPTSQIDADSPPAELLTAIRTWLTIRAEGANDIIARYVAAARLGLPQLDAFMAEMEPTRLANGSFTCMFSEKAHRHDPQMMRVVQSYGVYTENFGFPLVLNEMMLQSHRGVIKLFPAMDPYLTAEFYRLRAVGGFLVSAAIDRGWIRWAQIEPTVAGLCRVRAFGPPHRIDVVETVSGKTMAVRVEENDLVFDAQPGKVYQLTPRPMTTAED